MHILIIPSEQYVPQERPLEGIFQKDQAEILKENKHKIGVISVSVKYSTFMLFKALVFKLLRIKIKNDLKKKSFTFIFKTLINKNLFLKKHIKKEVINNIPVFRIETYYKLFLSDNNEYKGWLQGGYIAFLEYVKKFGKPDIIHAHNMVYAGVLASKIKQKHKIPIIVTEHSSYYVRKLYSNFILKKINNSFKYIDEFLVVSDSLGVYLKEKFIVLEKFVFFPNVLDNIFIKTPFAKLSKKEAFVFVNVGVFIAIKGQADLIKAFSLKFKGQENVNLKIIGGGELRDDLINLANEQGVGKQVDILEQLTRKQIIEVLDKSDVFVFSSKYETFGVAVIEALSRGLPVVSTKSGGPESIINNDNGVLVEKNINALADGMLFMKNSYTSFDKDKIIEDCKLNYGKTAFYKRIMNIYTKLLQKC